MNTKLTETVAVAVAAIFASYIEGSRAEESEVRAFGKVLKSLPLADDDAMKAMRDALLTKFGEEHKDAAQYRLNIVNNARKVAHGGTKDGKKVAGKGIPALHQVIDGAVSMRELKPAMSEAVPAKLKGESGGKRTGSGRKGKGKGKGKAGSAISIPKVATRDEAFAAARKVLEFCIEKFTKPSETKLVGKLNAAIEVLK